MQLHLDEIESPIGRLILVIRRGVLVALDFEDCRERMQSLLDARYGAAELEPARDPRGFASRIRSYFDGALDALDAIPVETRGTPFQRRVWSALRAIPPGRTASYGELASRVGRPGAARAVGAANGRNPVALVQPCHRVIAADGSLSGYAGGVERKRWLLAHEGLRL